MILESKISQEVNQWKYANGGFDILRSKLEENPEFENNELCFIDLLDEEVDKIE